MRIPTFSRQSDTADATEADRPAAAGSATTPVRPRRDGDDTTVTNLPPAPPPTVTPPPANPRTVTPPRRTEAQRAADLDRDDTADLRRPVTEPVAPVGPKPRASLLATLGLILAVASAMLVLSGPLLGYGIGVAGLALVLSLAGIHATGKRHVAGKVDALIGLFLSLAAIVVGVLALTGSLSWLGTDLHPVESVRHWLDTRFGNRF